MGGVAPLQEGGTGWRQVTSLVAPLWEGEGGRHWWGGRVGSAAPLRDGEGGGGTGWWWHRWGGRVGSVASLWEEEGRGIGEEDEKLGNWGGREGMGCWVIVLRSLMGRMVNTLWEFHAANGSNRCFSTTSTGPGSAPVSVY